MPDNVSVARRPALDLSSLDDKLLDGLKFCSKVYDLFDQVRAEPDGIGKLRLRPSIREKRLLEELLPIADYIQARYSVGNRMKVRWLNGSQPYDAIIWTPLIMVRNTPMPRKIFLEVTTSAHKNAHLARRLLHENGGSFGAKGIKINKKTRVPDSVPYVNRNGEHISDLATQVIERLADKVQKKYPSNTVLIVNCNADTAILENEWNDAIQQVESTGLHKSFWEVFLVERTGRHFATLWGARKQRRRR